MGGVDDERYTAEDAADGKHNVNITRLQLGDAQPYTAQQPCKRCGGTEAILVLRNGQNTVSCAIGHGHIYNASKAETGQEPRTAATLRQGIRPGQQQRILERDLGQCIFCHTTENLTIGHILSLDDGRQFDLTPHELNNDANLAAMCEACNLGLGSTSTTLRFYTKLIMARVLQAEVGRSDITAELFPAPAEPPT